MFEDAAKGLDALSGSDAVRSWSCSCRYSCLEASSSSGPSERTSSSSWSSRSGCALWAAFVWAREGTCPPSSSCCESPWWGAPVTVPDSETSKDWGDTKDPGDGAEGWNTKPVRKRPLSGEHQEGRGHKEAPRSR
ncbi:hypothetical protein AAFF_G00422310 [Aldrovandia affinis]|uniref:Uncharacterized protein n=1 Tax=Aldrovandia affinis TaxID=143900 RepID=A0AAD7R3E7_9TELE|nr:hypothetical protein AAFF_G00422310 [Aldrovandia affinis]